MITRSDNEFIEDYYNDTLRKAAIHTWLGYYCELFLLKELIVIVHDENTHQYCRQHSFTDFLKNNIIDTILIDDADLIHKDDILNTIKSMIYI